MRVGGWTLKRIWSFLRPCLQASRFPLKRFRVALLESKMFQIGLPCYLGLNSGWSISISVKKTRKHFFQKHSCLAHVSPMFPSFPYGKHCFQFQFLFSRCKLCLRYTTGNFNENPSMRAPAKILRAQASEHSSDFCKQFEQRPNFASTFKLDGTIRYP